MRSQIAQNTHVTNNEIITTEVEQLKTKKNPPSTNTQKMRTTSTLPGLRSASNVSTEMELKTIANVANIGIDKPIETPSDAAVRSLSEHESKNIFPTVAIVRMLMAITTRLSPLARLLCASNERSRISPFR